MVLEIPGRVRLPISTLGVEPPPRCPTPPYPTQHHHQLAGRPVLGSVESAVSVGWVAPPLSSSSQHRDSHHPEPTLITKNPTQPLWWRCHVWNQKPMCQHHNPTTTPMHPHPHHPHGLRSTRRCPCQAEATPAAGPGASRPPGGPAPPATKCVDIVPGTRPGDQTSS